MLTETCGSLYVGGYERPFAAINVKVLYSMKKLFISLHCNLLENAHQSLEIRLQTLAIKIFVDFWLGCQEGGHLAPDPSF